MDEAYKAPAPVTVKARDVIPLHQIITKELVNRTFDVLLQIDV